MARDVREITEGRARIKLDGAFYNPRMRFCRDIDMLVFSVARGTYDVRNYIDSLAATGVRGIRAALEAGYSPSFNDRNPKAVKVIEENLRINGIRAEVFCRDASVLLRESRFDHVDIDPFGSPAEFLDSACFSAVKFLSVTATDTAALCGSATLSGLRKYFSFAIKTDAYHETGLRMLVGAIAREAAKYEKFVKVEMAWAKEHYYRVHVRLRRSTSLSGRMFENIGYLIYCPECHAKRVVKMQDASDVWKSGHEHEQILIGPLWIGKIKDNSFVSEVYRKAGRGEVRKFVGRVLEEVDSATVYDLQKVASRLKKRVPKTADVLERLESMGFEASRVHYCGCCVRTNAEIGDVEEAVLGS